MTLRISLVQPVALNLLSALFQRIIAIPTAPRLLVLAAIGVTHLTFAAPMSAFGQPHEGLLVVGAMVAGELLGHPFELWRRAAFAREAIAAGRVPDADPTRPPR